MRLRVWWDALTRRRSFAILILAPTAVLFPAGALAAGARACTAGTTLRLSAPEASQGSLLLMELKSAKPIAEVQGEWGGRSVPLWRQSADEAQRRGFGIRVARRND